MYFELQFSGDVFTRVVRNRLRALDLCQDLTFPDPLGGPDLVVDEVLVGDATTLQRERALTSVNGVPQLVPAATQHKTSLTSIGSLNDFTVPYVQVRQGVEIRLVRESDLAANGTAPTPAAQTIMLFPVFNIALSNTGFTQGGGPLTLSYALAYIDFGLLAGLVSDAQRVRIAEIVAGVKIDPATVDLSALTGLLGRRVTAINSGLACDPDGTCVALRVDFDVRASPFAVGKEFFVDGPADLLHGRDWAMLMDANVLIQGAEPRVKTALGNKADVKLLTDPVGRWDAGATTMSIATDIRLVGACPSFLGDIDMDVHVDLGARFSVPAPNSLSVHYQLNHWPTDAGQVFGCAITGALVYPLAGAALLEKKKIGLTDYLGGIAFGPFFAYGQLLGVINAQQLEDDISDSLGSTCHKINNSEYECTTIVRQSIQFVPRQTAFLRLEDARGVAEGLVLAGPVVNFDELKMGALNGVQSSSFGWRIDGRCHKNRDGGGAFRAVNSAGISVDVTAPPPVPLPARVCTARILADPLGIFALSLVGSNVTVKASVTPAYLASPYPCQVRVVTNRGVRTIDLGTAQARTAKDDEDLSESLHQWKRFCGKIALTTIPFDELYEVPSGPEPPKETFGVDRWLLFRRLEVSGLVPQSRIVLRDLGTDAVIVEARPSAGGIAQLSVLSAGSTATIAMAMNLELVDGDRPLLAHNMTQQQILYAQRAAILPEAEPERLRLLSTPQGPRLIADGAGCVSVYDLSVPARPRAIAETHEAADAASREGSAALHGHAVVEATASDGGLHVSYDRTSQSILIYQAVRVGRPGAIRQPPGPETSGGGDPAASA